jgi:hypothetical protein
MKIATNFIILACLSLVVQFQVYALPASRTWSAEATTGAAMGYCLAKHPYRTIYRRVYTGDGYQIVKSPGIVGAVRRNFIFDRTTDTDEGINNTCEMACKEFGKLYAPSYVGVPLKQKVGGGIVINSGIGDMAALAMPDWDFYHSPPLQVTAGIWSRGNTWHESDVAQADFCCCQATKP